ncbi:enoyl-CoA hydratase/isomerase family protein [Saccharopolyspora dendranthemae]|uniref:Enoyl-CoA hydratase/isomerase-like protein n=1 Tax=Saccharopolyspora dendranthemae TaxID=1181886 RepID=A0A561U7Z4_9PSEU|nr:enoyl-CoA hydratase/isomerase family protein [Saccharopolyspora dendranthemae]TWF95471.1 enoyl-CoA hydratase/isomerase-like protein [Saccharopolyspora dendranthemae]
MSDFGTLDDQVRDRKAYLTLNRPDRLNAINDVMPSEIREAVRRADEDDRMRVIVLQGAGRAFCAGYDLKQSDGITRHSPEGRWFHDFAERDGFHAAVAYRDSGQVIPDGGGRPPEA